MICDTNGCGCGIISSDLSASITGSGTPDDPWDFAVGDPSAIADLEVAVASILATLATLPNTYVKKTGDAMSGALSITAVVEALQIRRTTDGPHIGWYDTSGDRIGYMQGIRGTTSGLMKIGADADIGIAFAPDGGVERMRITSDGLNVLFFKSATNGNVVGAEISNLGTVYATRDDGNAAASLNKTDGGSGTDFVAFRLSGSAIGSITRNAATSAVLYNTSSDEQLKNVIGDLDPELAAYILDLLQPLLFSWKDDAADTPIAGYIAQQVATAWPQSIELGLVSPGEGDISLRTWDEDGNETTPDGVWRPWQMDKSVLIPILHAGWKCNSSKIAALRTEHDALRAEHDALVARVAALEGV
jgi:hypothetical protein